MHATSFAEREPGAAWAVGYLMATSEHAAAVMPTKPRVRLIKVAANITVLNLLINAMTVITGPLQARALGPAGRGELAAIMVPLSFAPLIADLGLSTFVTMAVAKGRSVASVLGTIAPVSVGLGTVVAIAGMLMADTLAGGRPVVERFLIIGFALTPLAMAASVLQAVNWAQEGWRAWLLMRAIPPVGMLVATVILFAVNQLTVATAAAVGQALGLLATLPVIATVRWRGRLSWSNALAAEGLRFGSKAWLFSMTSMANARLDQLVMTQAVPSRELGYYAVATNVTVFEQSLSSGVVTATFPRVSRGAETLIPRACRVTIWLIGSTSAVLIASVGTLLPMLFGSAFGEAVSMAQILLAGAVAVAGMTVLANGLTGLGLPGRAAKGELLGVLITVPGLLLLLDPLGGEGAALVSLVAYTVNFLYLLRHAAKRLQRPYREFLIPRRHDFAVLASQPRIAQGLRFLRPVGARWGKKRAE